MALFNDQQQQEEQQNQLQPYGVRIGVGRLRSVQQQAPYVPDRNIGGPLFRARQLPAHPVREQSHKFSTKSVKLSYSCSPSSCLPQNISKLIEYHWGSRKIEGASEGPAHHQRQIRLTIISSSGVVVASLYDIGEASHPREDDASWWSIWEVK